MNEKTTGRKAQHINSLLTALAVVVVGLIVALNLHAIIDWAKLRNYQPSQEIASIADQTAMTDYGKRLFYVNYPQILTGTSFTSKCSLSAEKTVILGCYMTGDRGIYLFDVRDTRLDGVKQTTAAHEMLHAGYERLSSKEKSRLNVALEDYYLHQLSDERIKRTIDAYRQTEPTQLANEMHSIFGTEIKQLPADIEKHYAKYFTDRQAVVTLTENYQAEFTSRRDMAADYDRQLDDIRPYIDGGQRRLEEMRGRLDRMERSLNVTRASEDFAAYNDLVDEYNVLVRQHNDVLAETKQAIENYNDIVAKRNALALEERQLSQAMDAEAL